MIRSVRYWALIIVATAFGAVATVSLVSSAQSTAKPSTVVHSAAGGWEYKSVFRARGWGAADTKTVSFFGVAIPQSSFWYAFGNWKTFEEDKELPEGTDIKAVLARLGSEGWELVSVTPISSFAGSSANVGLAGATTEVHYWFKRAKR